MPDNGTIRIHENGSCRLFVLLFRPVFFEPCESGSPYLPNEYFIIGRHEVGNIVQAKVPLYHSDVAVSLDGLDAFLRKSTAVHAAAYRPYSRQSLSGRLQSDVWIFLLKCLLQLAITHLAIVFIMHDRLDAELSAYKQLCRRVTQTQQYNGQNSLRQFEHYSRLRDEFHYRSDIY